MRKLWLVASLAGYVAAFGVYGVVVLKTSSVEKVAQLSDTFGMLNAFFSGLALFGVVIAIALQRQELELQRDEIALNRQELARSATAQEESQRALIRSMQAQAYKAARDILQDESVRTARATVLEHHRQGSLDFENPALRKCAEILCHTYNTVGQMVRYDMVPESYIVESWSDSIRKSWNAVRPMIGRTRTERQFPQQWADFEYLATAAYKLVNEPLPPAS